MESTQEIPTRRGAPFAYAIPRAMRGSEGVCTPERRLLQRILERDRKNEKGKRGVNCKQWGHAEEEVLFTYAGEFGDGVNSRGW